MIVRATYLAALAEQTCCTEFGRNGGGFCANQGAGPGMLKPDQVRLDLQLLSNVTRSSLALG